MPVAAQSSPRRRRDLRQLSAGAQERLLRAVEYGEVTRIGANRPIRVDVRIVAATNEHLPALVEQGRFRADLLDRLSFEVVTLPPLRVRDGDIPILADHFGRRMASELEWNGWPGFNDEALAALTSHDWPGNVRELRNVVERAVYRWNYPDFPIYVIEFDPFESPYRPQSPAPDKSNAAPAILSPLPDQALPGDFKTAVSAFEKAMLESALIKHRHNQRHCAKALGLSYDQLRHAMRKSGLLRAE